MKTGIFIFKSIFYLVLIWGFSIDAKANPTIKLLGKDTIRIERGRIFTDPGAEAYDASNNLISGANIVVTTAPSIFSNLYPSKYIFAYNYTDKNGLKATEKKRVVMVIQDTTPPIITITGKLWDSILVNTSYYFPKITVYDSSDGNLTPSVYVENNLNTKEVGVYMIKLTATDASGNKSSAIINVWVIDTLAPAIYFKGNKHQVWYVSDTLYIDKLDYYVIDNSYSELKIYKGGSLISDTSVLSNNSIFKKSGIFSYVLTAMDPSGNTGKDSIIFEVLAYRTYNISGSIYLQNNTSINRKATVYLIKFDAVDSTLSAVDTYMVASGNAFSFNNIMGGNYLVKAALDSTDSYYANYLPTYYYGELKWDKATTISLGQNTSIPINMLQGNNSGGPGFIAGKVSQGANKAEGDPLENIEILLTTLDDKPVAYAYSDKNGYFEFKNLAYGEYKLFGEVAGLKSLGATLKLDEGNKTENRVEVRVNSTYVSTTINASVGLHEMDLISNINIYPNPASNKIYIYNAGQKYLRNAKMYNMAGQLILNNNLSSENSSVINVENLPNGIYILQLDADSSMQRKMIIVQH